MGRVRGDMNQFTCLKGQREGRLDMQPADGGAHVQGSVGVTTEDPVRRPGPPGEDPGKVLLSVFLCSWDLRTRRLTRGGRASTNGRETAT